MDLHFAPFAAGIVAGANGTFVGHPFDTLKTRFQVGRVSNQKVDLAFIRQLYRGILPPLVTSGAIQSTSFFLFENIRSRLRDSSKGGALVPGDLSSIFVSGCVAGSVVSLMSNPISIIKIRQQIESSATVRQCVRDVYAVSGWKGFYRGMAPMVVLDASRGMYFMNYEILKRVIVYLNKEWEGSNFLGTTGFRTSTEAATQINHNSSINSTNNANNSTSSIIKSNANSNSNVVRTRESTSLFTKDSLSTRLLASSITGMISWIVIYPIDVIRSRLHLDFAGSEYKSWYDCMKRTYAAGGLSAFYRGLGFTLVRAGPVSAASLTTYEFAKEFLQH